MNRDARSLLVRTEVIPSTTVAVGEKLQAAITVQSDEKIEISSFSASGPESLFIAGQSVSHFERNPEGKWQGTISLNILPLDAGEFEIPSQTIPYKAGSGEAFVLQTPPAKVRVTVGTGAASPDLLRDIKGPAAVYSLVPLAAAAFLALAFAAFWFFRNRRKPAGLPPEAPPRPAHEIALERLEEARRRFERDGDAKIFFSELSLVFRSYLSARFRFDAVEKTTSEIFRGMRETGIDRKLCLEVKDILALSDLVKFAKFLPQSAEIIEQYGKVKAFIEASSQ